MFLEEKIIHQAITFDDILLVPSYSEVSPLEASLETSLTDEIKLRIPIVSAAMDTVTESSMAKAIAREGGLGFIHKNMSIIEQAQKVIQVKRSENGMIEDPISLRKEAKLSDAHHLMDQYHISGIPIVEEDKTLIGIITKRDIKYRNHLDAPLLEVMTKENLITSDENTSLEKAKEILLKAKVEKLPIVDKEKKLVGLITMRDIDNLIAYPNACKDRSGRLRVGAAVGIEPDTMERVEALVKAHIDIITIDSAHGHTKEVINKIKAIRHSFPHLCIIGGNIISYQAAKDLVEAGVNVLKVGIGPGSICTTRVIAGVGMPQITAIDQVYQYTKDKKVSIISDGGIKFSGDILKAIAVGADCVMIGGLLAGCEEAPGEEIIYQGRKFKTYVGMGSIAAMKRGSKDRYFQSQAKKLVPEGIEARVPYKGKLRDLIYQLCGGLKSGMGYCGCSNLKDLTKKARFVKITHAGLKESHPHDVTITKEAPNYYS